MTPEPSVPFSEVPIERVEDYWNQRPCNIRHSAKPLGTKEYFDEVEERKYFVEPHIRAFAEFPRWRGKRVLEVGCGIGTDTISFARNGARVQVVELSSESLAIAKQRAEVYGLTDQIDIVQGNAEELTSLVPAQPYDLIYSFGVIHHTPHPERVIDEIVRLATPETTVKIMVYNRWSWKVAVIAIVRGRGRFWRLRQLIAQHSEAQFGSPITYAYTKREFCRLLEARGLRVVDAFVDHIFPYAIKDYAEYRYVKRPVIRVIPPRVFRWVECRFGWHLCVTAVLAGTR